MKIVATGKNTDMKRKINLKWARSLNDEYFNFGDDLNSYIIKKLSGCDVKYIHFGTDRINTIKQFIGTLPKIYLVLNIIGIF